MTTVNLSCFAGAGAQFFDNNGIPLVGGLLYTYAAGTTTQTATYTTSSGSVANSNPIVLDSAGRVPNEIWLINGSTYKFILQTSAAVQIGSWDNIPGSNDYSALLTTLSGSTGSSNIGYTEGNSSAIATTVQAKLRQNISVFDFMTSAQIADVQAGTLTQDVTAAIQAALVALPTINSSNHLGELLFPPGYYKCTGTLTIDTQTKIRGAGAVLNFSTAANNIVAINVTEVSNGYATDLARSDPIGGLMLIGPGSSTSSIGILVGQSTTTQVAQFDMTLSCVTQFGVGLQQASNSYSYRFHGGLVSNCGIGAYFPGGLSNNAEIVEFHGVTFSGNTTASLRSYGNSLDILVVGGSFDYDTGVNIDLAGDTIVQVVGTHFEFASAKQVAKNVSASGNPLLYLTNCTFTLGGAPSTTPVIDGSQIGVYVNGGWFRINASGTQTTFLLSNGTGGSPNYYYTAVIKNLAGVFQGGASVTNWINGLDVNPATYYESGPQRSDVYGLNGSFYSDQTVALSGTTPTTLTIPFPQQAKGAFIISASYNGNSGPQAVWAVAAPDYGNTGARTVINSLATVGGLTTGETLSLTWPANSNYPALAKSGSGWNGNYSVSVQGV
jgi:hypothetical protein